MAAPESIRTLVKKFEANFEHYHEEDINEEDLRHQFLNPFFRALGWDLENEAEKGADRDVKYEKRIKSDAPDFGFYIDGKRKFFVEAKKPHENVCRDPKHALQLRWYGWNGKHARCILTDFEEFAIYDTTIRPREKDKASKARIACIKYTELEERWSEIEEYFSRESVEAGRLDRELKSHPTQSVDDDFLESMSEWRKDLAENIALRNPHIASEEQLNRIVQTVLDRIIFLRVAEARGIEAEPVIQQAAEGEGIYRSLLRVFQKANDRYDAKLFEPGDELSIAIDDKELKKIISELYFPKSPYNFYAIPADILGQVYEQFLGKHIRLTEGHTARIVDKYELRHGSGVYYTPTWIVEYIVRQTVGALVKDKMPKDIKELTVVDPACGSGSFLIGAYQYLLDWYRDRYVDEGTAKHEKEGRLWQDNAGIWQLSLQERKNILLRHIYGVDIDRQAVEIAKLSLMLKSLEAPEQKSLFGGRVLPQLEYNIKQGNSLISTDYDGEQTAGVHPLFNWREEFPQAFARDGFDAVIGNPPYVRQESLGSQKEYYESHYKVYAGTADLYSYFLEKGIDILRPGGQFSYIVSNKWMRAAYGKPLRQWLKNQALLELSDFGHLRVFENATTYTCIIRATKGPTPDSFLAAEAQTLDFFDLGDYIPTIWHSVRIANLSDGGWSLADERTQRLLAKIRAVGVPLGKYVEREVFRGIVTGLNEAFVIDQEVRDRLIKEDANSAELIKPFLLGRDIKRYQVSATKQYLIFTRRGVDINKYPAIEKHLLNFKAALTPKPKGWKGEKWPGRKSGKYAWCEIQDSSDYWQKFENPKICWGNLCKEAPFAIDEERRYINAPACIIARDDKFLLGILNSKVLWYFLQKIAAVRQGGYIEAKPIYVEQMPIPELAIEHVQEISERVAKILEFNGQLFELKPEGERVSIQRQIAAADHEIDQLVYKIYGLSEDEVRIVEESAK